MEVVYNANKSGLDTSKKIYECSNCGKLFNWNENSSWYGTMKQWDECSKDLKFACSEKCQVKLGK